MSSFHLNNDPLNVFFDHCSLGHAAWNVLIAFSVGWFHTKVTLNGGLVSSNAPSRCPWFSCFFVITYLERDETLPIMVDDTCQLLLNGWGCLLSTVWCIDDSLFGSQNLQCYDLGHRSTEKHGTRHQQLVVHGLIGNRQPRRLLHLDLLELILFLSTMLYHHAWNMCAFLSNHAWNKSTNLSLQTGCNSISQCQSNHICLHYFRTWRAQKILCPTHAYVFLCIETGIYLGLFLRNGRHQDYFPILVRDPYKPSFATIYWAGGTTQDIHSPEV